MQNDEKTFESRLAQIRLLINQLSDEINDTLLTWVKTEHTSIKNSRLENKALEDVFEFNTRIHNVLKIEGIQTVKQLLNCTPKHILTMPNLSRKSLWVIQDELALNGLRLTSIYDTDEQ